ncbi:hypothetical protein DPMN_189305 [Dreissena polymorpha]|uniref:Uncharacterized protein n=1 Tax=Dreissena polymorpha TaxID=45954 RepID=A0A9D4DUN0_DREPO|nr:hypothetical protein DPMN_189305 [Dreissena polymorpha]
MRPTYNATFCLAPFGRTRCTLTSRRLPIGLNYVLRDILPCTLTSRRLPIGLNKFRPGLLIRIGRITGHFAWPLSDEQELSPGSDLVHADQPVPFGRTRCTLTSRRLPIGLKCL